MDIVNFLQGNGWLEVGLKWGFVSVFFVCFLFTLLMYRHVQLMSQSLGGALEVQLKLVTLGLMVASGVVLVMAVMVL